MKNFIDPIRPSNLTGKKFVGFFSGVIAALGGFYAFMVAEWWGYDSTETKTTSTKVVKGVKETTTDIQVDTRLDHALNLQGLLGAITPAAFLAVILGIWGAVTLKKAEQRFIAVAALLIGAVVMAVVLWVNVITPGKADEHYWRGVAFAAITLLVWCFQAAYYHVRVVRRRRTTTPVVVI